MTHPLPHEIRDTKGRAIYCCRSCKTDENLRWFEGTSCPVCTKQECLDALRKEFNEAYFQDDESWQG